MIWNCEDTIFTLETYPIYYNGIAIAQFRFPTEKQMKGYIYKTSTQTLLGEEVTYFTSNIRNSLKLMVLSLDSWIFPQSITEDNIENLNIDILTKLLGDIMKYINEINNIEAYKNNLKKMIELLENGENLKLDEKFFNSSLMVEAFCSNCKLNKTDKCDNKKQKILKVSQDIIKYAYLKVNQKTVEYPRKGTWEDQTVWFNLLYDYACSYIQECRNNKMKREQDKHK